MRYTFLAAFSIVLILYSWMNYYIASNFLKFLSRFVPNMNVKVYWVVFWIIAFSYIFARVLKSLLPYEIYNVLTFIGAYWLGIMFYSFIILILVKILELFCRWTGFFSAHLTKSSNLTYIFSLTIIGIIILIAIFGIWSAKSTRVVHYDINIPKKAGNLDSLKIVALSDIHLGILVNESQIKNAVDIINGLNPDIVLFVGDTVDEDINIFKEKNMVEIFNKINSKIGNYAIMGNHEYIGGHPDEAAYYIEKSGIKVLKDQYLKVNDNFYIIGRDDISGNRMGGRQRKELSEMMMGVDKSLPIILLDHQPVNLKEAQDNGVDLQLSGHTHKGQLFPNMLITNRIFEIDWGHLKKSDFNVIVSSGFGTWGPPMRIGTRSEILEIDLKFGE